MNAQKGAILAAAILASIFVWAYFLAASGFSVAEAVKLGGIEATLQKIASIQFILFVVIFPVSLALCSVCAKMFEKKEAFLYAIAGSAVGIFASFALFGLTELFIVGIFYIIGAALLVENAFVRLAEVKKYVLWRVSSSSARRAMGIIGIGLFVSTALMVYSNQQQFVQEFEDNVITYAFSESVMQSVSKASAQMIVDASKGTAEQITNTSQFEALKTKQDAEVQEYVVSIEALKQFMNTPAYTKIVEDEIKKADTSKAKELVNFNELKKQIPMLGILMDYYWALAAFGIASIFMILSGIVLVPLAGVYGIVFGSIAGGITKEAKLEKGNKKKMSLR